MAEISVPPTRRNVIAFPGVTLTERELGAEPPIERPVTTTPCPVCAIAITSDSFDLIETCRRCGAEYHVPCFWRALPLEHWIAYWRYAVDESDQRHEVVCAACRKLEGPGEVIERPAHPGTAQ